MPSNESHSCVFRPCCSLLHGSALSSVFAPTRLLVCALQVVKHMVHGAPCVTITGQKGIGKTQVRTPYSLWSDESGLEKKIVNSTGGKSS